MSKTWTIKERRKLINYWKEGLTLTSIEQRMKGRTLNQVTYQISRLKATGLIQGRHGNSKRGHQKYSPKTPALKGEPNTMETQKMTEESTQMKIINTMEDIRVFLIKKNKQYGDSAMKPMRIFSKANSNEQLKVRIDDKLNRLVQGNDLLESDEDVVKDLIGYLILLLIDMKN